MDSEPGLSFEDIEIKLTNFDEKIQAYAANNTVSPHLAFSTGRGYTNRGRGQGRSGYSHGRGSYSTRGRVFINKSVRTLPLRTALVQLARYVTSTVIQPTNSTSGLIMHISQRTTPMR